MTRLEAALVEFTAFLDQIGLPYMLIGGLAVAVWGEPRATLDVDLSVWVEPDRFEDAVRQITGRFSSIPDALEFARRSRVLPIATSDGIRADIVFGLLPEERQLILRAVATPVEGAEIRVASVEDLVYMKLISERLKDLDDARRLIRRFRSTLDREYLEPRLAAIAEALGRPDIVVSFRSDLGQP